MVVAQMGLGLGIIAKSTYSVIVFMAIATTLVAPPLIGATFRGVAPSMVPEEQEFRLE
jgi:Kef-type K+ transport system membrane component KefB